MKNLFTALVSFHSNLKPIKKDAQNPFFKSDYLTLSGILDSVRPQLSAQGLAIIQGMKVTDQGTSLITSLIHVSGESMHSEMIMPVLNDPQKMGSLITYYKRYQLQALLGISTADEDDDANLVSQPKPLQQRVVNTPVKDAPVTDGQLKAVYAISKKLGIEVPEITTFNQASAFIKANGSR